MKTRTTLFGIFFILGTTRLLAQTCMGTIETQAMNANSKKAYVSNAGRIFSGPFGYNPGLVQGGLQGQLAPSTIFTNTVWMAGLDPSGNAKISAPTYLTTSDDAAFVGPIVNGVGVCTGWNRHFKVLSSDVNAHLNDFMDNGIIDQPIPQALQTWPAKGNPYFTSRTGVALPNQDLAPFVDRNGDGLYQPNLGDYPVFDIAMPNVIADEIVYSVSNDVGPNQSSDGLGVERHLIVYAFASTTDPVLDHTVFVKHKLIKKTGGNLTGTKIGIWVDFDLGCEEDDYIGSAPAHNTFYVYNGDNNDQLTGCHLPGFGVNPPVQTVTLLDKSLDGFMYYINDGGPRGNPNSPSEYLNFMNSTWRDSQPLSVGGSGYNSGSGVSTRFAFSDLPNDPNGWSMVTGIVPPSDMRAIGVHDIGAFNLNQVFEMNTSYTLHIDRTLSHIDIVPASLGNVNAIQNIYDSQFIQITLSTQEGQEDQIKVYPNPAHDVLIVEGDVVQIELLDIQGRVVLREKANSTKNKLNIEDLLSGCYFIRTLGADDRVSVSKLIVAK